jgi:hypothetical protein
LEEGVLAPLLTTTARTALKLVGRVKGPECAGPTRVCMDLIGPEAL